MRRSVRAYIVAGTCLILAAVAGFGLPWLLLHFEDGRQLGRIEQEEVSRLEISEQPALTIVQKVRLMQRDSTNSMVLEKGRNYTRETIWDKVDEELNTLADAGIPGLPLEMEDTEANGISENMAFSGDTVQSMEPVFLMDVEGENSFIVWQGQLYTDSGVFLDLYLDDETGKILSLSCYGGEGADTGSAAGAADSFGSYLGCYVASRNAAEPEETADMSGETKALYLEEVRNLMENGWTEEEAYAEVNEKWGLENTGYLAHVTYGDESGMEMQYEISFSGEGGSLYILPQ